MLFLGLIFMVKFLHHFVTIYNVICSISNSVSSTLLLFSGQYSYEILVALNFKSFFSTVNCNASIIINHSSGKKTPSSGHPFVVLNVIARIAPCMLCWFCFAVLTLFAHNCTHSFIRGRVANAVHVCAVNRYHDF